MAAGLRPLKFRAVSGVRDCCPFWSCQCPAITPDVADERDIETNQYAHLIGTLHLKLKTRRMYNIA